MWLTLLASALAGPLSDCQYQPNAPLPATAYICPGEKIAILQSPPSQQTHAAAEQIAKATRGTAAEVQIQGPNGVVYGQVFVHPPDHDGPGARMVLYHDVQPRVDRIFLCQDEGALGGGGCVYRIEQLLADGVPPPPNLSIAGHPYLPREACRWASITPGALFLDCQQEGSLVWFARPSSAPDSFVDDFSKKILAETLRRAPDGVMARAGRCEVAGERARCTRIQQPGGQGVWVGVVEGEGEGVLVCEQSTGGALSPLCESALTPSRRLRR